MSTSVSRRAFLRFVGASSLLLVGGGLLSACLAPADGGSGRAATPSPTLAAGELAAAPRVAGGRQNPDLEMTLRATESSVQILSGRETTVWRYEASVTRGDQDSVRTLPNSWVGPIIRVRKGQRIRVTFVNDLPARQQVSIVHWHGLHLPEDMDAHPRYVIRPGQSYVYDFTVTDRAGTYWFHPHPDMLTGRQVYMGLAGLFIVTDDEESAIPLPTGDQDVPLVIQDRTFDGRNQLVYLGGGMGTMMARMMGFLGQQVLVNGAPSFVLDASTRAYRLRLLNGSNSRIYKLAWSDGAPLTVIGSDGGLLERPAQRPYVMLAPGERVELWADWSRKQEGEEITLESLRFEGAETDAMMGMMGRTSAPPLGAAMRLMKVRFVRREQESLALPASLSPVNRHRLEEAANREEPRQFRLSLRGMQWLINGRTFEMDAVAPDETVRLGTTELWEFVNARNPGQMEPNGMAHPIHIHGLQFNIVERQVVPELRAGWDTVREGYVDEGWKDTLLIMPGERVRLLLRFVDHTGRFVYHCHNLEHEDQGMMRNYMVEA